MENPVRTRELGIQGLKVINDSPWEYIAENEEELSRCNKCNCNSLHFIRPHSRQLIDALNISSKPRIIDLIHQHCHFQCQSAACCKVVEKIIHFAAPKHRMTYRLEKYVYQRCLADKIENVESELGGRLSATAIFQSVLDQTKMRDKYVPKKWGVPETMGIHHAVIKGLNVFMVTNIEKECIIDILPDASENTLLKMAARFGKRGINKIKTIWIDLNLQLLDSVKTVFPNAQIIIGRYELKRFFTNALLEALAERKDKHRPTDRTFLRNREELSEKTIKKLDKYLKENEDIELLYQLRLAVAHMSAGQIMKLVDEISDNAEMSTHSDFLLHSQVRPVRDIVKNSVMSTMTDEQGLDITGSYHESMNCIIEEHLFHTRKCSFDIMRARILYSDPNIVNEGLYREWHIRETEDRNNEMEDYCMALAFQYFPPSRESMDKMGASGAISAKYMTYGQPIKNVAYRLKKFADLYGV